MMLTDEQLAVIIRRRLERLSRETEIPIVVLERMAEREGKRVLVDRSGGSVVY